MSSEVERLFVALCLPPSIKRELSFLAEPMPGVTWIHSDQLHVTLRFLGDVTVDRIPAIEEKLSAIRVEPFLLPIEGLGGFPPKSPPRVLWVGLGNGHPRLYQLRQRLDDALLAAGLDLDVRTFHPHITLARCTEKVASAAWLRKHEAFAAPPFRVEAFDLCSSILRPSGAEHNLKRRFLLASP